MSRFRVVVTSSSNPLRPYGWEIMDEGSDRCAMRSRETISKVKGRVGGRKGGAVQLDRCRWQRPRYGGRCPPIGRHRYFHKLYALDAVLPDLGRPTKAQLDAAMKGHVLASCRVGRDVTRRRDASRDSGAMGHQAVALQCAANFGLESRPFSVSTLHALSAAVPPASASFIRRRIGAPWTRSAARSCGASSG